MLIRLPDDVDIEVPIEVMTIKDSIFVPTLKPVETRALLRAIAKDINIKLAFATLVVDGYLGVQFWRVDRRK